MSLDGPEQRTAYFDELAARTQDAELAVPYRRIYAIENVGSPVTLWWRVVVDEREDGGADRVVQVDLYADEALSALIVDDIDTRRWSDEQRQEFRSAVFAAQCGLRDREAFARRLEQIQAALR